MHRISRDIGDLVRYFGNLLHESHGPLAVGFHDLHFVLYDGGQELCEVVTPQTVEFIEKRGGALELAPCALDVAIIQEGILRVLRHPARRRRCTLAGYRLRRERESSGFRQGTRKLREDRQVGVQPHTLDPAHAQRQQAPIRA